MIISKYKHFAYYSGFFISYTISPSIIFLRLSEDTTYRNVVEITTKQILLVANYPYRRYHTVTVDYIHALMKT